MRIVLFTVENTEFVPTVLEPILSRREHQIVPVFVSRAMFVF